MRATLIAYVPLLPACASTCDRSEAGAGAAADAPASGGPSPQSPPWDASGGRPATPTGMVWIPGGALVAGTPPDLLPRIADEEMPGQQVILSGFFIAVYPYPNEEGAIPLSNVTRAEARALCEQRDRRLCTELEWERACKGPDNHVYEYGDRYRPELCGTGAKPRMLPSGIRVGCKSDFKVHDLHGGLWEWTSSAWGRGAKGDLVAVRGGNAPAGELVGRCANAMGRPPDSQSPDVGFRCCAGPENDAEVNLQVVRRRRLQRVEPPDNVARSVEEALTQPGDLDPPESFRASRMWYWRPLGNEELVALGGCGVEGHRRRCGVAIVRMVLDRPKLLAWADSGRYVPTVKTDPHRTDLWVYGGDKRSHYRRLVSYAWGRVTAGTLDRNVKPLKSRRRRKRR